MSRFISKKLITIDLWEWEWVKIPKDLSYEEVTNITKDKDEITMWKSMLINCIKEWNLKDEEGEVPKINEKSIMSLNIKTITELTTAINENIFQKETLEETKKK